MTMSKQVGLALVVAAILAGVMTHASAQTSKPRPTKSATIAQAQQALPLTCVQAWVAAKKSYPQMINTVKTLARVSLANRDLTFPNTREAGLDAGKGIAEDCKADPHALFFAVVDKHVRRVATATTANQ